MVDLTRYGISVEDIHNKVKAGKRHIEKEYLSLSANINSIYKDIVDLNGEDIVYVADHYITQDLCNRAIASNMYALEHIPERYHTYDIYLACLDDFGYLYNFIMFDHDKLYELAIERNGFNLLYLPVNKRTSDLCLKAVLSNPSAIEFIPNRKKTDEICDIAVKFNPYLLKYCSISFQNNYYNNEDNQKK